MRAKQYLQGISRMNRMIDLKIAERERLWSQCTRITQSMDADRVQSTHDPSRGQRAIDRLIEIEAEIYHHVDAYADERDRAISMFELLEDDRHHDILYRRYVIGQKWQQIAVAMSYDIRWIYEMHGRALAAFQKILDTQQTQH